MASSKINKSENNNNNNENAIQKNIGEYLFKSVSLSIGGFTIDSQYSCDKCKKFFEMHNYFSGNLDNISEDIEYIKIWKKLSSINLLQYDIIIKQLNLFKKGKQICTTCLKKKPIKIM